MFEKVTETIKLHEKQVKDKKDLQNCLHPIL